MKQQLFSNKSHIQPKTFEKMQNIPQDCQEFEDSPNQICE